MLLGTLKKALEDLAGSSFIGIDTETSVKLAGGKKNEMQDRVVKKTVNSNVMVFANKSGNNAYENMVKKRLLAEGKDPETFELGSRAWGTRIEGTPFIEHNGKTYLEVIFLKPGESEYFLDGKPISKDQIVGLKETATANEESQGGLDNKVIVRTYDISKIVAVRANKETWK